MKEAMRMHPSVGYPMERYVPAGGVTIAGKYLPAGTIVSMAAPVIHFDTSIYGTDAHVFRPERWLESEPERIKLMDRNLLTVRTLRSECTCLRKLIEVDVQFGYGARTCIGKNISIMEMGKFVPQMFRHFDIEWASKDPEWKTHAAWFWKQSDMWVKFRPRKVD